MTIIQDPNFIITDEVFDKCTDFAEASVASSVDKYARRNQFNVAKIKEDIRNGKIAEEYVWQKLIKTLPRLSPPDYEVYDKKHKNWSADLIDPAMQIKIACKCQDIKSAMSFGTSWVFQGGIGKKIDTDKGIFQEKDDNHYVAFISLNTPKRIGELRALIKVSFLHENDLFKPMKLKNLQNNKVAVYMEDLMNFSEEQLWQL